LSTRRGVLAAAVLALGASGVQAAEASAEVDLELLEFLGSLDAEDEDWREYLAERPVRSEMGKPAPKAGGKPEARDAKEPAPKQDKVK
jgi:hypothetical protein